MTWSIQIKGTKDEISQQLDTVGAPHPEAKDRAQFDRVKQLVATEAETLEGDETLTVEANGHVGTLPNFLNVKIERRDAVSASTRNG